LFYRKLINSFYYASEGIVYSIATQRNMKIHISFALLVLLIGMGLHFVYSDVIILLFSIGIVIAAEAFNTAIETVVDLVTEDYHAKAKIAKDVAAGSVLITVFIAILVGIITIFPYIKNILIDGREIHERSFSSFFILLSLFILLFNYLVKAYWYGKHPNHQPHVFLSILFIILVYLFMISFYISLLFFTFVLAYIIYLFKNNAITITGFSQNIVIVFGWFIILNWLFT